MSPHINTSTEVLMTWEVIVGIPRSRHPGKGRHRPPLEALHNPRRASVFFRRLAEIDAAQPAETCQSKTSSADLKSKNTPPHLETCQPNAPTFQESWAVRRTRLSEHLHRARRMQHWIDADPGRKAADAARKEGISRPRVSQLLSLLQLSPSIQEDIDDTSQTGPVPGERELWDIARLPSSEQVCRYQELTGKRLTDIAIARKTLRHTGFQHLFVRARRLKAMLDSGDYRSMAEIGLVEGISGARVAQLLNLLELSPELQTQLDVPAERAPRIQEEQLRKVARLRSHEAQKAEFLLFLKEG